MRKILVSGFIILMFMLIMPLSVMKNPTEVSAVINNNVSLSQSKKENVDTFRVYDKETETVTEISAEEYIFGVLAAEMPALYDEEALKAQAVASYTFAIYKKEQNKNNDYDITSDHTTDQSYISRDKLAEKWGDKVDEYTKKLEKAVREVKNLTLTYEGKPILAVYHAISSGQTENAKDIWGKELSYLKSVSSPHDKLSPNYITTTEITAENLKNALSNKCEFSGNESNYFKNFERTKSGTVKSVKICGTTINGDDIRSLFSLRSANFEVEFKDGKFNFTVYGYGHGVGMSQYGADYMAKQGSNFKEILTHYYKGCEIE